MDKVLTVSELDALISKSLKELFYALSVEGEVTNFRKTGSAGHWYFSLKDRNGAIINCTCFRNRNWNLKAPQNGDVVVATGRLSFWDKGGSLTFNCDTLKLKGEGDIKALIEARRRKYEELGYFDPRIKKPLPEHVETIGVVTSDTGAVIKDIIRNSKAVPGINILIFPCAVQGEGAEFSIASRIRQANNFSACDVLIVGRGGGSEEDLLPYSSEAVIEAIHDSEIPIISAVGHENDWPIADFVADHRASTPTGAAMMATDNDLRRVERFRNIENEMKLLMLEKSQDAARRLSRIKLSSSAINEKVEKAKAIIREEEKLKDSLTYRIDNIFLSIDNSRETQASQIRNLVKEKEAKLEHVNARLSSEMISLIGRKKAEMRIQMNELRALMRERLNLGKSTVVALTRETDALNPLDILSRGYAIVRDGNGKVITKASEMHTGDTVNIKMKDGEKKAEIKERA